MTYHGILGWPKAANEELPFAELCKLHRDYCLATIAEVNEVLLEVPWKPWKQYAPDEQLVDRFHLAEELADVFFFLVGICEIWDISPDLFSTALGHKMIENFSRIDRNYNQKKEK